VLVISVSLFLINNHLLNRAFADSFIVRRKKPQYFAEHNTLVKISRVETAD